MPNLVSVRVAMVVGAGSANFVMMSSLLKRLPAMVCPKRIDTRPQPVAVTDVVDALLCLADHVDPPAEVQLGGADVPTDRDMMRRLAEAEGRRPQTADRPRSSSRGRSSRASTPR